MTTTANKPTRGMFDVLLLFVLLLLLCVGVLSSTYPNISNFERTIGLKILPSTENINWVLPRVSFYLRTTQFLLLALVIFITVDRGLMARLAAAALPATMFGMFIWLYHVSSHSQTTPTDRWIFLGVCAGASMVNMLFVLKHYALKSWTKAAWGIGAAGSLISEFTLRFAQLAIPKDNTASWESFRKLYQNINIFERVFFLFMLLSVMAMLIETWKNTSAKPTVRKSSVPQ
jgi:hypothetical protein